MCYTGKCPYENYMGDCTIGCTTIPNLEKKWLQNGVIPHCLTPVLKLGSGERTMEDMKILNKNKKMKYSKMLIDYDTYEKICVKYGTTIDEHIKKVESYQKDPESVPDMSDISIMLDVYSTITKVIRKRR